MTEKITILDKSSFHEITNEIIRSYDHLQRTSARRVILITGPSGSGKTEYCKNFPNSLCLSTDDFYFDHEIIKARLNGDANYDDPGAIDITLCAQLVAILATTLPGMTVLGPHFDKPSVRRNGVKELIVPGEDSIIVLEGIFSFHIPFIYDYVTLKMYLESDPDTLLQRRLDRDLGTWDEAYIREQYKQVMEGFNKYILPVREQADLIVKT